MNTAQLQHAINWWNFQGNFNTELFQKVLEAKKEIESNNQYSKN